MAKLNKLAFRKALALTVGYILFMLITKLWVKEPQILPTIFGVLISSIMVGMIFYFCFYWQDIKSEKKKKFRRIND